MMMRIYKCPFNAVAVTAQQDLFEILAATGKPIYLLKVELSQSSEVGDAQEEGLNIKLNYGAGSVTSGSGGSTVTPTPLDPGDSAAGATIEINNTTRMVAGSGTITLKDAWNWNIRIKDSVILIPEERIKVKPGDRITLELATTPADSITMTGVATIGEIC